MPDRLDRLETIPTATEFYGTYWNKRPFVVRGAIPPDVMAGLIEADELAGLSMEDGPQSRLVKTAGDYKTWTCQFGPFSDPDFSAAGRKNWSLLVQNVEQFHPQTAALLPFFNFAPRWMMDDVMVSFSAPGGSVGPHLDSYHVFLIQGQGTRRWKISREIISNEAYVDNPDLKILATEFEGDEIEVSCGDALYVPPNFGHEGTTIEAALTFSVGFLGPKTSELFSSYGQYLSEREDLDQRYVGKGLEADSAGFLIADAGVGVLRYQLRHHLETTDFVRWLVEFFSETTHESDGDDDHQDALLSITDFKTSLQDGAGLFKPESIKFAVTTALSGASFLGFDGQSLPLEQAFFPVLQEILNGRQVFLKKHPALLENRAFLDVLHQLYTLQALEISAPTEIP